MDDAAAGPTRGRGMGLSLKRLPAGVLGILLMLGALFLLTGPINVVAYYLGYGEEMRIEVTTGTSFDSPSDDSTPGRGRVIGEDRVVELYGVTAGEVVTARPRLIEIGATRYVYTGHASVLWGLTYIFGVVVLGLPGLLLLILGFAPPALLERLAPTLTKFAAWLSKYSKRGNPEDPGRVPPAS